MRARREPGGGSNRLSRTAGAGRRKKSAQPGGASRAAQEIRLSRSESPSARSVTRPTTAFAAFSRSWLPHLIGSANIRRGPRPPAPSPRVPKRPPAPVRGPKRPPGPRPRAATTARDPGRLDRAPLLLAVWGSAPGAGRSRPAEPWRYCCVSEAVAAGSSGRSVAPGGHYGRRRCGSERLRVTGCTG
jgi:hypothetical protein